MNNMKVIGIVVVILVVGSLLIFQNRGVAPTAVELDNNMPVPGNNVDETIVVKEVVVDATSFSFNPATIEVNKGDTVKITVKNAKGTHDLKIDEFNVATRLLNVGEEETVMFIADKSGIFQYYCSVGTHRTMGMVGTLTVR